jgi:hypothetical protein
MERDELLDRLHNAVSEIDDAQLRLLVAILDKPHATIPANAKWDDPKEDGSILILIGGLTVQFGGQVLMMNVSAFAVDRGPNGNYCTLGKDSAMTSHLYEAFAMDGFPQSININGREYTLFMEPCGD